jgi:uncharacterized protein YpbB
MCCSASWVGDRGSQEPDFSHFRELVKIQLCVEKYFTQRRISHTHHLGWVEKRSSNTISLRKRKVLYSLLPEIIFLRLRDCLEKLALNK